MRRLVILLCLLFLGPVWCWGLCLPESSAQEIYRTLESMKGEVQTLRAQSAVWQESSKSLRVKCDQLEIELNEAALSWEKSEGKVLSLKREAERLMEQLESLRQEYQELKKSCTKQKRKAAIWKGAAVIAAAVAVEEMTAGILRSLIRGR